MGTRGPKGKPLAVRQLEGNPGKRALPKDVIQPEGPAERPAHVTGYAATVWDRVIGSMPGAVYRTTDEETLAAYCLAAERLRTASEMLAIEGHVIYHAEKIIERADGTILRIEERPIRNPWGNIAREATKEIAMLGTKLGLDPIARENIKTPEGNRAGRFGGLLGVIDGGKVG